MPGHHRFELLFVMFLCVLIMNNCASYCHVLYILIMDVERLFSLDTTQKAVVTLKFDLVLWRAPASHAS